MSKDTEGELWLFGAVVLCLFAIAVNNTPAWLTGAFIAWAWYDANKDALHNKDK